METKSYVWLVRACSLYQLFACSCRFLHRAHALLPFEAGISAAYPCICRLLPVDVKEVRAASSHQRYTK
ncbi:hypothetical protein I2I11_08135 [Pontibacter sp. 172403-2]|uniref:hypothetical protein n=1 Tax=Pontibacter rufus TaxID=2791028 RepID=UPI0018AF5A4F|nr:hypothetical protein [Pontibacter sp. 172403-2]MBF9253257.1 hypothetical protein [Pontibacter sp. 172403-2]